MKEILAIYVINLLTSIDNAIVIGGIANRHKNLLPILAVSSVVITVCRTALIVGIASVAAWPGFRLLLGVGVLFVAIGLARVPMDDRKHFGTSFWGVLSMVVVTDLALSVDNVLSIAVLSANPLVIAASVFFSLLPLFMLLPVMITVMNQVLWLRILAAGFVAELAVDSITDDPFLKHSVPSGRMELLLRVLSAVIVIAYGFWHVYGRKHRSPNGL
ncbi:hypothetical protein JZ785_05710 [Alicyclobacillus curvatus]|nr:hypothetical protein JZ785_05710 [Alicyclobacillus curvatus]